MPAHCGQADGPFLAQNDNQSKSGPYSAAHICFGYLLGVTSCCHLRSSSRYIFGMHRGIRKISEEEFVAVLEVAQQEALTAFVL